MARRGAAAPGGPDASAVAAAQPRPDAPPRLQDAIKCSNAFLACAPTARQLIPHNGLRTASSGLTSPEHVALAAQLLSHLHRLLHLGRGVGKNAGVGACRRDAIHPKVTQAGRTAGTRQTAQQFNAAEAAAATAAATGLAQQGSLVAAPCR